MPASTVIDLPPKKVLEGKRAHWGADTPTKFINPWPSWRLYPAVDRIFPYVLFTALNPTYPNPDKVPLAPILTPNWGGGEMKQKIKSTWLGHACFLLELPAKASDPRGIRILFDPVFSKRCSSSQAVGPKRYTAAPCKVEDIPDIDVVVISHDHYDHMDGSTLRAIFKRPRKPLMFAPLGNGAFLKSAGADDVHIMDWWDSKRIEVQIPHQPSTDAAEKPCSKEPTPAPPSSTLSFDITCTPCQHFTGRKVFDDFRTLWCSWAIEASAPSDTLDDEKTGNKAAATKPEEETPRETLKVYFAGDTGYRSVRDDEDEAKVPTCPAFKEIGEVFGGFDFAMIPIGAYQPRQVMSPIHCAPQDSVKIFKDIRARKALGMHWGTWILTTEAVDEPPRKLAEECDKLGIPQEDFGVCAIGETRFW